MSDLLQERLQESRRAEIERLADQFGTAAFGTAASSRHVGSHSSGASEHSRPASSGSQQRKGLAIKEMDQTVSTLHKQNFDLKLEVHHRRERQNALEKRLAKLEREVQERKDANDTLKKELERRDKALNQAVAMIVSLESQVELLRREQSLIHQVVTGGSPQQYLKLPTPMATTTPKKGESLNRMRVTVKLTSLFLGTREATPPKVVESTREAAPPKTVERSPSRACLHDRIESPTFSTFSEISIGSILAHGRTVELQAPPKSPMLWDSTPRNADVTTPTKLPRSTSQATSSQFKILDMGPSPLEQLEKLDRKNFKDLIKSPTSSVSSSITPVLSPQSHHCRKESTASSVDTWLQESIIDPMSSASQANSPTRNYRLSPELFSIPSTPSGWSTDSFFGSSARKHPSNTPIVDILDAIDASVPSSGARTPTLGPSSTAPPLPARRSSLSRTNPTVSESSVKPSRGGTTRTRRNSAVEVQAPTRHELGLRQDRAMTVPPKQVHVAPPPGTTNTTPKQRHYPPTTSRPRSRGLNNLFRRSIGSSSDPLSSQQHHIPAPPASAPAAETTFKQQQTTPQMGIPSWVRRASLGGSGNGVFVEEEARGSSATPPPILRNRGPGGGGSVMMSEEDGGAVLWSAGGDEGAPVGVVPGGNGGGKRKWLGLGRVSSLRSRGAG